MTTAAPLAAASPTSPRRAAIIAGIGYVVLFALAFFANFFVRENLVVAGDAAATAANIADAEMLFRLGLVAFLVIFLVDVVVAWALYILFRSADRDLSLLTAWFRLVYTVFLGVAAIFFYQTLELLSGAEFLDAFSEEQLHAQALLAMDAFNATWLIGLAAFGIHLVLLGSLVITSRYAPRALGWVLIVAGCAYVLDTSAHALLANYQDVALVLLLVVAIPSVIAEGWFGLWLLFRGGKSRSAGVGAEEEGAAEVEGVDG